ncbi:MAG: PKD domain-containing protein, partial [Candidatus Hydrogenedentes bacterium]|nr:PKD domain-containing protein [Candidatus Hydrogenedentota bacterium]
MSTPVDLAVNTMDGSCWVVCDGSDEIVKLSADGSELARVGGFQAPRAVAVDPLDGVCWVTDIYADKVVKLSPLGARLVEVGVLPNALSVAASPGAAAAGSPTALAAVSPDVVDVGEDVTLDGSGSTDADGGIVLYEWDFEGDGVYDWSSDTGGSTTHAYTMAGVYTPVLRVTDTDHLRAVDYTSLVRVGSLTAVASADPTDGLAPLTVQFTGSFIDPVDGRIDSYQWDFDSDGTFEEFSETTGNTSHVYDTAGEYTATLKVVDGGATATATVTISVGSSDPQVNASATTNAGSNIVSFNGSASDPDGSVVLYSWDFDNDGTFDWSNTGSAAATHQYPALGTYEATLQVTDNDGLSSSDTVEVRWPPTAVADVSPVTGNAPLTINYDASGSTASAGTISTYYWNFGWPYSSNEVSGTHTFDTPGTYNVSLRITDDSGQQSTDSIDVVVRPSGTPFAMASSDYAGPSGPPITVNFSAAGSSDPGGGIVSYDWDFGFKAEVESAGYYDGNNCTITLNGLSVGTNSRGFNVVAVDPATYTVLDQGSFDTYGSDSAPTELASFLGALAPGTLVLAGVRDEASTRINEQAYAAFESIGSAEIRNLGYHSSFAIIGYKGDAPGSAIESIKASSEGPATAVKLFASGWSSSSTGDTPFTYTAPGNYQATLTVTDGDGLTDTATIPIRVRAKPRVNILSPIPGSEHYKQNVPFDAETFDQDGEIVKVEWDFDDDAVYDFLSENSSGTTYTFDTPGTYTAVIRVTDNDGLTATDQVAFDVVEAAPSAVTVVTDPEEPFGETPLTIGFDGTVDDPDGTVVKYEWDFDGDGTYDWSNGGTAGMAWNWPPAYTSNYEPDKMIDGNVSTYWSTVRDPSWPQDLVFSLDGNGEHDIDRIRIMAKQTRKINEFELLVSTTSPTSGFVSVGTFALANETSWQEFTFPATAARYVMLRISSSHSDGRYADINEFEVYAGTENVITAVSPRTTYIYPAAGTYTAVLRVTDNDGNTATGSTLVRVYDAGDPVATASAPRSRGPIGMPLFLHGSATDDGTITQYEWDFDNDGTFEWSDTAVGTLDSFTSQYNDTNWAAANIIDGRTGSGYSWASSSGVVFPQEMVVSFAGGAIQSINAAAFNGATGSSSSDLPKEIELWVSTTAPDSGYTLVGTFELARSTGIQTVRFPAVDAKYVKLVIKSNFNGGYCRISEFEVFSASTGNNLLAVTGDAWHSWDSVGSHTARLRATDDEANQGVADVDITTVAPGDSLATLWVSEYDQIGVLDPAGSEIKRIYGFNDPVALALDAARHTLWVSDKNNGRVVAIDTDIPNGYDLRYNDTSHRSYPGFNNSQGLSIDPADGSVWVADYDNGRVVRIGPGLPAGYNVSAFATSPSAGPGGVPAYLVGSPTSATGAIGQGLNFGAGDFAILPDQLFDGLTDFTFEAWVKHSFTHDGALLSCASNLSDNEFLVFLKQNGTRIEVLIANGTTAFDAPSTLNDGAAHHVAVTRSGTDLTLYI